MILPALVASLCFFAVNNKLLSNTPSFHISNAGDNICQGSFDRMTQIGSGGTGIVYKPNFKGKGEIVLKVSKPNTEDRLKKECLILSILENVQVRGVEKCIRSCQLDTKSLELLRLDSLSYKQV